VGSVFILDALQVDLLHDCKVEVLEGEEGGDEDSAQANGQHDAHEAAVDHRVDAVAYESKDSRYWEISPSAISTTIYYFIFVYTYVYSVSLHQVLIFHSASYNKLILFYYENIFVRDVQRDNFTSFTARQN
jgi:hypothetical protein